MKQTFSAINPSESDSMSPAQIRSRFAQYPAAEKLYDRLTPKYQSEFLDFCSGKTSLYLCYDTFFHFVFDTNTHRDRVEHLLSALLGQEVYILEVLPREGTQMAEMGSEVVVDLLVRLEDHSLVNLEIQKYGYKFPAMRMDCYCADLIMREYNRLHNKYKENFTYKKLHPVIAIVLLEQSPEEFKSRPDIYIHHGQTIWDSGLKLPGLTRQIYVCLDKFHTVMQNKDITTPLDAWLTLLTTRDLARIDELVRKFPFFADIYREIFKFRTRPEELIRMYSEALAAADRNMDRMMIDEFREELEQLKKELSGTRQDLTVAKENLTNTTKDLADIQNNLADTEKSLADTKKSLADTKKDLADTLNENKALQAKLSQGEEYKLCEQILKKIARGQSVEQIADALEETPEHIQALIEKLSA